MSDGGDNNSSRFDRSIKDKPHGNEESNNSTEARTVEGNSTKSRDISQKNASLEAETTHEANLTSDSAELHLNSSSDETHKNASLDEGTHLTSASSHCANCSSNGIPEVTLLEYNGSVTLPPPQSENRAKQENPNGTESNNTIIDNHLESRQHSDNVNSTEVSGNETASIEHSDKLSPSDNKTLPEGHKNQTLLERSEVESTLGNNSHSSGNKTFSLEKADHSGVNNESSLSELSSAENITDSDVVNSNKTVPHGRNGSLEVEINSTSSEEFNNGSSDAQRPFKEGKSGKGSKGTVGGDGDILTSVDSFVPSDPSIIHTVTTFLVSSNVTLNGNNFASENLLRLGDSSDTILTKSGPQANSVGNSASEGTVATAAKNSQDLSLGAALLIRSPTPPAPTQLGLIAARDSGTVGNFTTESPMVTFAAQIGELPIPARNSDVSGGSGGRGAKPPGMMPPPEFLQSLNPNSSVEVAIGGSGTNGSPTRVATFNQDGHTSITTAGDVAAKATDVNFASFTGGSNVPEDKAHQEITAKPFGASQQQLEGPAGSNNLGKSEGNIKTDKTGVQPQPLERSQDHTPSCKETPQPGAPRSEERVFSYLPSICLFDYEFRVQVVRDKWETTALLEDE